RGTDSTLIVEEFGLILTSIMVSVLAAFQGVPARWSEPITRIVWELPGVATVTRARFSAGVCEMSAASWRNCISPATAVAVAANRITITAPSAKRPWVPRFVLGSQLMRRRPHRDLFADRGAAAGQEASGQSLGAHGGSAAARRATPTHRDHDGRRRSVRTRRPGSRLR